MFGTTAAGRSRDPALGGELGPRTLAVFEAPVEGAEQLAPELGQVRPVRGLQLRPGEDLGARPGQRGCPPAQPHGVQAPPAARWGGRLRSRSSNSITATVMTVTAPGSGRHGYDGNVSPANHPARHYDLFSLFDPYPIRLHPVSAPQHLRGVTVLMIMLSCINAACEHQPCDRLSGEFSPLIPSTPSPTGKFTGTEPEMLSKLCYVAVAGWLNHRCLDRLVEWVLFGRGTIPIPASIAAAIIPLVVCSMYAARKSGSLPPTARDLRLLLRHRTRYSGRR